MRAKPQEEEDSFYSIYVVDPAHRLLGVISLSKLLSAKRPVRLKDLMATSPRSVNVQTDQEEVALLFQQYGLVDMPVIDKINIRQATLLTMRNAINKLTPPPELLLVDGNDFKPYIRFHNGVFHQTRHICIEGGDNKYTSIAAASILAKVERDLYIKDLCEKNPHLVDYYGIDANKGYGTKKHLDGIRQFGISEFHRKTYGICREYS